MKLLIIDNYDSFVYNIVHAVRGLGAETDVARNDRVDLDGIARYDKIIISPGPGVPSEAGLVPRVLERYATVKPILGVCLGHQAIGEYFGAKLRNLSRVYHGLQTAATVTAPDDYLWRGLPSQLQVGRYHSWVVDSDGLPPELQVTAVSPDGEIMALRHASLDIRGLQFHPESILTPQGTLILQNWLNH